jgi:hypothetical protein
VLVVDTRPHNPSLAGSMLPAEIFETGKRLFALSLAKPRYNVEAVLTTYELFAYGHAPHIHYILNSCVNMCCHHGDILA